MRRARRVKLNEILRKLRSENQDDVIDAGTSFYRFDDAPLNPLLKIIERNENPFNREFATYSLTSKMLDLEWRIAVKRGKFFYRDKYKNSFYRRELIKIVKVLIKTIETDDSPTVRAQALETLGMSNTAESEKIRLRTRIEKCVIDALSHETHEVRFWACYAAGQLKIKKALPKLRDLAENDREDWGQWWFVSEEAEDAIDWIYDRDTEPRIPVAQRKLKNSQLNQ